MARRGLARRHGRQGSAEAANRPALALELHQEVKLTTGEKVKKLRLVARSLVDNAIDGDTTAARECFDRMDGKVPQSADATQARGDITVTWVRPAY
jgi:ribosomal protein L17